MNIPEQTIVAQYRTLGGVYNKARLNVAASQKQTSQAITQIVQNIRCEIAKPFNTISSLGITYATTPEEIRKTRISNQLALYGVLAQLPFLFVHLADAKWLGVVFNLFFISLGIITCSLNYGGNIFWGKVFQMTTSNLGVFITVCMFGHEFPETIYLSFSIILLQFWLSNDTPKERAMLLFFVAFTVTLFIILRMQLPFLDFSRLITYTPEASATLHTIIPFVSGYFILIGSYVFWQDKNRAERRLAEEAQHSEKLLLNIMPQSIATRLKGDEKYIADYFPNATVLFADLCGFTRLAASMNPQEVVAMLNTIFTHFDSITQKHGVEKIKTIGDAYMLVGGIPDQCPDHIIKVARAALEIQATLPSLFFENLIGVTARIGIHTGEVVAGVIGTSKFSYDMWGDTVNMASRMESHGEPGKIHCSEEVYLALKEKFLFEPAEVQYIKGKGTMQTWFLLGERSKYHSKEHHTKTTFQEILPEYQF